MLFIVAIFTKKQKGWLNNLHDAGNDTHKE